MNNNAAPTGFTLIELLLVIAIIGILASLILATAIHGRNKAADIRIKNDIRQLRWLAEIAYNDQNNNFTDWSLQPKILTNVNLLIGDINASYGETVAVAIGQNDTQTFCVSAPLKSNSNQHFCIDASREVRISADPCPTNTIPHACP